MQQDVIALLQLFLRHSRRSPHRFDRFLRQRHHLVLSILFLLLLLFLFLLLPVGLHDIQRSQQAAIEHVADEGAFLARILHRKHRKRAVLASLPRKRRSSAGIRRGKEGGERRVEQRARNESENASGVSLLLEGRENQNLAEPKRMGRRLEGVGEDVEKAKPR